jgi:hypothetical protein
MIRRSAHFALLVVIYIAGIVLSAGLSIWYLVIDYAGRDWIALLLVAPFAWTFSYWPTVGSIMMILKVRRLQGYFEEVAARARANDGKLGDSDRQDLMDMAVDMAGKETGLPRFITRRIVRRYIARMITQADPSHDSSATSAHLRR